MYTATTLCILYIAAETHYLSLTGCISPPLPPPTPSQTSYINSMSAPPSHLTAPLTHPPPLTDR